MKKPDFNTTTPLLNGSLIPYVMKGTLEPWHFNNITAWANAQHPVFGSQDTFQINTDNSIPAGYGPSLELFSMFALSN